MQGIDPNDEQNQGEQPTPQDTSAEPVEAQAPEAAAEHAPEETSSYSEFVPDVVTPGEFGQEIARAEAAFPDADSLETFSSEEPDLPIEPIASATATADAPPERPTVGKPQEEESGDQGPEADEPQPESEDEGPEPEDGTPVDSEDAPELTDVPDEDPSPDGSPSESEQEPDSQQETTPADQSPDDVVEPIHAEEAGPGDLVSPEESDSPSEPTGDQETEPSPEDGAPAPPLELPRGEEAIQELDSQTVIATDDPQEEEGGESEMKTGLPEDDEESSEPEEFTAITTLEYLPPSKKEGEADDPVPQFSSVGEARAVLEGFLFTTNEPLSVARLSKLCGNLDPRTVRGLLLELQMEYDGRPGGLQVIEVAGGFQLATRPHIAEWMFRLHKHRRKSPLSPATLETLAIIAYKQPVTKGEVEAIRGVESSGTFRTLQDLNLIDVGGRREVPGRPQLYVTTPYFLKAFGLNALADLPSIAELRHRFADEQRLKAPLPANVKTIEPAPAEAQAVAASPDGAAPSDGSTEGLVPPPQTGDGDMEIPPAVPPQGAETPPAAGDIPFSEEEVQNALREAAAKAKAVAASGNGDSADSDSESAPSAEGEDLHAVEAEEVDADDLEEDDEDLDEDDEDFEEDDEEYEDEEETDEESDGDTQEEASSEADEGSSQPEEDVPPPPPVSIKRVPKPPRKGGWGVGRPLMFDEEEE